jgi:GLPGLI family protein
MKQFLFFAVMISGTTAIAQPKLVNQAIINTTTTIIAPEEEDVANVQIQGQGGGGMARMFSGDGETKTVTHVKNDLVKSVSKTDMGRTTSIRDNQKKLTTTLIEIMGNKTGFFATDEEMEAARKSMDSMMRAGSANDTAKKMPRPTEPPKVNISVTDETKKIAGYTCKKAYVITTRILGIKDTAMAWFTPDVKINNVTSTGGGGFSSMMSMGSPSSNPMAGLELIDGFVMRYETKMRRNRTMIVEVTKLEIEKEVADKEFMIPKDFDVKPMSEMRNMMRGAGGAQGGQRIMIMSN